MRYFIPSAAALLLAPAAFAQTTTPGPQTATPTPTDQASPDPQSMSTATDSSGAMATPATGAAAAKPTIGATVYGSAGTPVGTIKAMDAQLVTLTTAKGDIRLPVAGIGTGPNGPTIAMTAEQLNTAIDQAKAAQPVATSKTTSAAATGTTTTKTSITTRKRTQH